MGGDIYWYVVPYEPDIGAALEKLRLRELNAGRYNPVTPFPKFPVDLNSLVTGQLHASFEEALNASDADGTRSIIDIHFVSGVPREGPSEPDVTAWPLSENQLSELFGTTEPSPEAIASNYKFWEGISRGSGAYIILKQNGVPHGIFFGGCSFD
ncbi:hypothetical protein [Hyphomicrobium sp. 2TAF46]|uniref:hypothetical protein n=1 Tax=Hyphomicrobium sp. 2TAF46 TaxID=3233019 RepID=UPI003F919CF5